MCKECGASSQSINYPRELKPVHHPWPQNIWNLHSSFRPSTPRCLIRSRCKRRFTFDGQNLLTKRCQRFHQLGNHSNPRWTLESMKLRGFYQVSRPLNHVGESNGEIAICVILHHFRTWRINQVYWVWRETRPMYLEHDFKLIRCVLNMTLNSFVVSWVWLKTHPLCIGYDVKLIRCLEHDFKLIRCIYRIWLETHPLCLEYDFKLIRCVLGMT